MNTNLSTVLTVLMALMKLDFTQNNLQNIHHNRTTKQNCSYIAIIRA